MVTEHDPTDRNDHHYEEREKNTRTGKILHDFGVEVNTWNSPRATTINEERNREVITGRVCENTSIV